jgi:1,2-phenylacetyl-CoA epoxidase catalytic subunit
VRASSSDFIATIYLAEQAISTQLGAYRSNVADRTLARLADKVHRESRFHLSYSTGWIKALGKDSSLSIGDDIRRRFAEALDWWGNADQPDSLFQAGYRDLSDADLLTVFSDAVTANFDVSGAATKGAKGWKRSIRRNGSPGIPPSQFERIRFKNHELALP